jgi:hypothetical protein
LEFKSAAYHRAAAVQARRLQAEATTRRLKEHLEDVIVQHERIAEEIERTVGAPPRRNCRPLKRNPRPIIRGLHQGDRVLRSRVLLWCARERSQVRSRLAGGGKGIRTSGPTFKEDSRTPNSPLRFWRPVAPAAIVFNLRERRLRAPGIPK